MRTTLKKIYFSVCFSLLVTDVFAANESPLSVIMDGREAAKNTILTENGMTSLVQTATNIILYGCGFLAVFFTAYAMYQLYSIHSDEHTQNRSDLKRSAVMKLIIAGLISIPAVVAAIAPYVILN